MPIDTLAVKNFAIKNIYCAPSQDRSYSFSLIRLNSSTHTLINNVNVYGILKKLPTTNKRYHVFTLGQLDPDILNLFKQKRNWFKDVWVNVGDDMSSRNYILKMYNQNGVKYPNKYLYYSFIDERILLFAMEVDSLLSSKFPIDSFTYINVYSNTYFNSNEFLSLPTTIGIDYNFAYVTNNQDKLILQNFISTNELNGGKALVYVDGYYTDNLNLSIPDFSFIEVVYDQSIISKERYPISSLRTFSSTKDGKVKYFLFRNKIINRIQYEDDNDIYIDNNLSPVTKGVYYYQHADYAIRNVTDKDYSLNTNFIVNMANSLDNGQTTSIQDKYIVLYTRKSGLSRELVYSSLKLHELYKLPSDKQLNTLLGTGNTVSDFRVEYLENSDYFKLAESKLKDITDELASRVLGYNGITYYFANTPNKVPLNTTNINVPFLYQTDSTAFEYDGSGVLIGTYTTSGPVYLLNNVQTRYVEFIYGVTPNDFGKYYINGDTFTIRHTEYKILSASFSNVTRLTNWVDITNDQTKVNINGNDITLTIDQSEKVKVIYANEPNIYDLNIPIVNGILYFPLTINEDRGTGINTFIVDIPSKNIEVFLNGYKLTQDIDYFLNFPYIVITAKKYINYGLTTQNIQIRLYGHTLSLTDINKEETRGFVNNGVLLRNHVYDIRDDRVMSIYVDGKLQDRNTIKFAEEDNTIRLSDPLNGLPYSVKEPYIPVKTLTNIDTETIFLEDKDKNSRISDFFNLVYPEPTIDETNIIADHHYLYSPIISKIIEDTLDGNIPSSLYTNQYDDMTILDLIANDEDYTRLLNMDPIKANLPNNIIQIHPHIGNTIINLNIYQYRFITNVIRVVTNNKPELVNISGYLTVTT